MEIILIDPIDAKDLINELDEYQNKLYPSGSCHLDPIETLQKENVKFYGVIQNDAIIAIGSVKLLNGYGELKRIYVPPAQRGRGLAKKIIKQLEDVMIQNKLYIIKLETGPYSKDAIQLYEKLGYSECEHFGSYKKDPLSTFMTKELKK